MSIHRRDWLKQTAFILAGMGIKFESFGEATGELSTDKLIWLNSNENPYGPSPMAKKAILDHYLDSNRYPDDWLPLLKKKLAAKWSVGEENILLGAGSSEIIGNSMAWASTKNKTALVGDPAYSVWQGQAKTFGLEMKKIPLDAERKYELAKMMAAQSESLPSIVYICNPNNPTGTFIDLDLLKAFVLEASKKSIIFLDEAYTEFAGLSTLASLAIANPNIIVAKTFSKVYGLAGARVGYAISHPDTIQKLGSYQPWPGCNVSMASVNAAMAALDDQDFVKDCIQKAKEAREICYKSFDKLHLNYIPSSTNFILFNIDKISGDLTEKMQAHSIYVQHREHFGGRWCRVSMGTIEEMKLFVSVLEEIGVA